ALTCALSLEISAAACAAFSFTLSVFIVVSFQVLDSDDYKVITPDTTNGFDENQQQLQLLKT
ncbi:MAG: hypothetical protein K2K36_03035, partial [Muribaculaceae bacterium]|nr:hypothetical protein [Muribaculaceae bacterium]